MRHVLIAFLIMLFIVPGFGLAQSGGMQKTRTVEPDPRQLVKMPEFSRRLMQQDMIEHLSAIQNILSALQKSDLADVADIAENRLGRSMMVKHRGRGHGMGPGRFMPHEMKLIGWNMHDSASALAVSAKKGDLIGVYKHFDNMMGACVACHIGYRTR